MVFIHPEIVSQFNTSEIRMYFSIDDIRWLLSGEWQSQCSSHSPHVCKLGRSYCAVIRATDVLAEATHIEFNYLLKHLQKDDITLWLWNKLLDKPKGTAVRHKFGLGEAHTCWRNGRNAVFSCKSLMESKERTRPPVQDACHKPNSAREHRRAARSSRTEDTFPGTVRMLEWTVTSFLAPMETSKAMILWPVGWKHFYLLVVCKSVVLSIQWCFRSDDIQQ